MNNVETTPKKKVTRVIEYSCVFDGSKIFFHHSINLRSVYRGRRTGMSGRGRSRRNRIPTRQPTGLYVHSSPPTAVPVHPSIVRQWLRGGEIERLTDLVLQGQGSTLVGEYSPDSKARAFINSLPRILRRIEDLHEAGLGGKINEVDNVLKKEPRFHLELSRDSGGLGLFHKAVIHGHIQLQKWLIDNYPETIHVLDKEKRNPLHYAGGSIDTWNRLVEAGADPQGVDSEGNIPAFYMLHPRRLRPPLPDTRSKKQDQGLVIKPSNIRIWIHDKDLGRLQKVLWEGMGDRLKTETSTQPLVRRFLNAVPYIMGSIRDVHTAAINNDLELLLSKSSDPVPKDILLSKDANGLSPLHKAAGLGNMEIVREILKRTPEAINVKDNLDRSPLHYAAGLKDQNVMYQFLVDSGAIDHLEDKKGNTPSYYRTKPSELEISKLSIIPDAPRTANIFPPSWDWRLLTQGDSITTPVTSPQIETISKPGDDEKVIDVKEENIPSEIEETPEPQALETPEVETSEVETPEGETPVLETPEIEPEQEDEEILVQQAKPEISEDEGVGSEFPASGGDTLSPQSDLTTEDDDFSGARLGETITLTRGLFGGRRQINIGEYDSGNEEIQEGVNLENINEIRPISSTSRPRSSQEETSNRPISSTSTPTSSQTQRPTSRPKTGSNDETSRLVSSSSRPRTGSNSVIKRSTSESREYGILDEKSDTDPEENNLNENEESNKAANENEEIVEVNKNLESNVVANENEEPNPKSNEDEKMNEVTNENEEIDKPNELVDKNQELKEASRENKETNEGPKESEETSENGEASENEETSENKEMSENEANINEESNNIANENEESNEESNEVINENGESNEESNEVINENGESNEESNEVINENGESNEESNEVINENGESNELFNENGESNEESNEVINENEISNEVDIDNEESNTNENEELIELTNINRESNEITNENEESNELTNNNGESNEITNENEESNEIDNKNEESNVNVESDDNLENIQQPSTPKPLTSQNRTATATLDTAGDDARSEDEDSERPLTVMSIGGSRAEILAITPAPPQTAESDTQKAVEEEISEEEKRLAEELVKTGDMEAMAEMVLAGQGSALLGLTSENPDVQLFINNIPQYMAKIERVHKAAREGDLRGVQTSLDRRKFAVARDNSTPLKPTPLHVAALFGRTSVLRYLAGRFPESMHAQDAAGRSALHYAATLPDNGHFYSLLVTLGANKSLVDNAGKTAEHYLRNRGELTREDLLTEYQDRTEPLDTSGLNFNRYSDKVGNDNVSSRQDVDDPVILSQLESSFALIQTKGKGSILQKILKEDIFEELKYRCTRLDNTLIDLIRPGVRDLALGKGKIKDKLFTGLEVPDYESYRVFEDIIIPVIKDMNDMNEIREQPLKNMLGENTDFEINVDPTGYIIKSFVVEMSRNLSPVSFPRNLKLSDLEKVEVALTSILTSYYRRNKDSGFIDESGENFGSYYSLNEVVDNKEVFQDLEQEALVAEGIDDPDSDNWPYGRGVFISPYGDITAWINIREHLKIFSVTSTDRKGYLGQAYKTAVDVITSLDEKVESVRDPILGLLVTDPRLIGNTLSFNILMSLPNLSESKPSLRQLCKEQKLHLQMTKNSVQYRLRNKGCLGLSEIESFNKFVNSVKIIIEAERSSAKMSVVQIPNLIKNFLRKKSSKRKLVN